MFSARDTLDTLLCDLTTMRRNTNGSIHLQVQTNTNLDDCIVQQQQYRTTVVTMMVHSSTSRILQQIHQFQQRIMIIITTII